MCGGKDMNMNGHHDILGRPARSHTSLPDLTAGYRVPNKTGYFCRITVFCDCDQLFIFPLQVKNKPHEEAAKTYAFY